MDKNRIAILKQLASSVQSGLNASISPSDCRTIIQMIAAKRKTKSATVNPMVEELTKAASEAIRKLGKELIKKG